MNQMRTARGMMDVIGDLPTKRAVCEQIGSHMELDRRLSIAQQRCTSPLDLSAALFCMSAVMCNAEDTTCDDHCYEGPCHDAEPDDPHASTCWDHVVGVLDAYQPRVGEHLVKQLAARDRHHAAPLRAEPPRGPQGRVAGRGHPSSPRPDARDRRSRCRRQTWPGKSGAPARQRRSLLGCRQRGDLFPGPLPNPSRTFGDGGCTPRVPRADRTAHKCGQS